jgi:hypothetical protein
VPVTNKRSFAGDAIFFDLAGRNAVARKKVPYIVRGGIPLNIL